MQTKHLRKSKAYNKLPKAARRKARRSLRSPEHVIAALTLHGKRLAKGAENVQHLVKAANDDNLEWMMKYGRRQLDTSS